MQEEFFDVYTREGKYLETKPKSFCHGKDPGGYIINLFGFGL